MAVRYNEWENKNQGRRYPLIEDAALEPLDLIVDLSVGVPYPASVTDIYIDRIFVRRQRICMSARKISDNSLIFSAFGTSGSYRELISDVGYVGQIAFGNIGVADDKEIIFTTTTGKLAPLVAYPIKDTSPIVLSDGYVELKGEVTFRGFDNIVVTVETISVDNKEKQAIVLRPEGELNKRLLPDCAVPAEEYWARLGRQGIISINDVTADSNGNIPIVFFSIPKGLYIEAQSGSDETVDYFCKVSLDRDYMCGVPAWRPESLEDYLNPPGCDFFTGSYSSGSSSTETDGSSSSSSPSSSISESTISELSTMGLYSTSSKESASTASTPSESTPYSSISSTLTISSESSSESS